MTAFKYTPPKHAAQFSTTAAPTAAPAAEAPKVGLSAEVAHSNPAPGGVMGAGAAAPAGNPMFAALFAKLGDAKARKVYANKPLPANITYLEGEPSKGNANWATWEDAWYVCEVSGAVEMVFGDNATFVKIPVTVHQSGGACPTGPAEIAIFHGRNFGDEAADFVSAIENIHIKQPDPLSPKGTPLVVRLMAEAVTPSQPLLGKFFAVHVTANRSKKPHKDTGKLHVYVENRYHPIEVQRDEAGNIVGFAAPEVDNRA